jgi:tetratricopeptide (TPR) repeat protein
MSLAPGTHLGRYEIRSLLGAGGMGEVYLAHDSQLNRPVAIKVLLAEVASEQNRLRRFMQEAQAASALNHPNILTVHEIGEAGSTAFIVTEFIDGTTLRQRLSGKRLTIRQVIDIAAQVADALARAHQAGIVHRDIKPDNIMVRTDGIVKVLDFGLAKLGEPTAPMSDASTRVAVNTAPGAVMGTARYMSPEQARGLDLDARTDIFSLGVVLYQMATGRAPFDGATTSDVIAAILDREAAPLTQIAPDLPHEFDRIVTKALAKDPDERYQVVKDLLLDLKALRRELDAQASAGTGTAPSTGASPAADRFGLGRHRWAVGLVTAGLVVAAVITGVLLSGRRAAALTERDTIVLADFVNTTGDTVFDGTLKQGLAVQLGQSPYLNIYSDDRVREALRFMGRSPDDPVTRDVAREICQRQGLKALLAGSIAGLGSHYVLTLEAVNAQTGDTIAREQAEADRKEQVLTKLGDAAIALREHLGESLASIQKFATPIDAATTSSLEALKAFALGDEHRARGTYAESIPLYKRATELDANFALAYARLATMYFNIRQGDEAARHSEHAFKLRDRVSERERFYIDARYYGDVAADVDKTIEVLQLWRQTYPRDYVPANNLAVLLVQTGQFERALATAEDAQRLNPNAASVYTNVAGASLSLGRFDEARAVLEGALGRKLESATYHLQLHAIGYLQGDAAAQQSQLDWAKGKPAEFTFLDQNAAMTAATGRLREARVFSVRSVDLTSRTNPEAAAWSTALDALRNAAFEECVNVKAAVARALALKRTRNPLTMSALALALCGETTAAHALVDDLAKATPRDTFLVTIWSPAIAALDEIHRNNPAQAVQILERARPYDASGRGRWTTYVRGIAFLRQRAGAEASAAFRDLMTRNGSALLSGPLPATYLYPLATLGLARAAALAGDLTTSRKAYQDLFALWKDADTDLAILRRAKAEYATLK